METIVVDCSGCKARLKVKVPPGRVPSEVKCPKCSKKIPVNKGGAPAAESPAQVSKQEPTPAPPVPVVVPETPSPPTLVAPPPAAAVAPAAPEVVKLPSAPATFGTSMEHGLLTVKCDACQWQSKIQPVFIGKKIRCKQCSAIILVGTGNVTSAPAPVVAPAPEPVRVENKIPAPAAPVVPPKAVVENGAPKTITLLTPASSTQALKLELEAAKARAESAEARAQEAEKALRAAVEHHATELTAARRKVEEVEKELEGLRYFTGQVAADDKGEIEAAEKRIVFLKERLTKFSA